MEALKHYAWLAAGCICLWIGSIGIYGIYATSMPSSPSILVFVAPFCFYKFVTLRLRRGLSKG